MNRNRKEGDSCFQINFQINPVLCSRRSTTIFFRLCGTGGRQFCVVHKQRSWFDHGGCWKGRGGVDWRVAHALHPRERQDRFQGVILHSFTSCCVSWLSLAGLACAVYSFLSPNLFYFANMQLLDFHICVPQYLKMTTSWGVMGGCGEF